MTDDLRARLVAAGVALVAEGAEPLSLREIARRAEVSHGAPRRYFPTHRELLAAIAKVGYAELTARIAALPGHGDPGRDVLALARAYVEFARDNRGMFQLMFRHELLRGNKEGLRAASKPLFAVLVQRLGPDRPDAAVVAGALWANLHGIAQLWLWNSLQMATDQDDLDAVLRTAVAAYTGAPPCCPT
ncbi:TetR/AcrR family transcriptional regulator [Actinoplanes sp. N902-109]|uniref:TetR/AcrR family transcriptional regulator n=1 Tax=Actinoplanes sp. (strain N902-109) TaxID=649831 RepID=UPI00032952EA|nr:TetR/AcrR family transcriptional regulator [Actinoplanes sp. N902-109]AGL17789.1 TetR family transcriptional regulator [Actinoplanes sp. N902-109]